MNLREEMLRKMVNRGAIAWTDIELTKKKKTKILNQIKRTLELMATPKEENQVKIEIVRECCRNIRNQYPTFTREVDLIMKQFEHHLRFDSMAVLPFKQLDNLTYRIFLKQSLMVS